MLLCSIYILPFLATVKKGGGGGEETNLVTAPPHTGAAGRSLRSVLWAAGLHAL